MLAWVILGLVASPLFGDLVGARITKTRIRADDRRVILLSRPFGFGDGGHIEFDLTNVQVKLPAAAPADSLDLTSFAIYMTTNRVDAIAEDPAFSGDFMASCDPSNLPFWRLSSFDTPAVRRMVIGTDAEEDAASTSPGPNSKESEAKFRFVHEFGAGVREVFYANCDPRADVSFDIVLDMYNVEPNGRKSYLSLGEMPLPTMFLILALSFTIGTGIFAWAVCKERANAHHIHHVMIALGVAKCLTLFALVGEYHYIRVTGEPDGWNFVYYVFTFFRGLLLFSVIILIGTGWSYMTPHLSPNEKRTLAVVLPLQVFAEIALVITDDFTPAAREWFAWRDVLHFVDIICCCAILFPIVWRIRHLQEAASTDGKAERSMNQLIMFRQFYIVVVIYIYFTRIVVFLLRSTLPFQSLWLADAASELGTLVFYTLTAFLFRPYPQNQYFRLITDQDLEMSEL